MSAFIVGEAHIRFMVNAGLYMGSRSERMDWYVLDGEGHLLKSGRLRFENVDEIGTMLWRENIASVRNRYPVGDLPGPVDLDVESAYVHTHNAYPIDPLRVLGAVACYEYQSCEHPGWYQSEARAFCHALRMRAIRALPGYDARGGWEVTDESERRQIVG